MASFRPFSAEDAVAAAAAALSAAGGSAVTIDAVESLGDDARRNLVLRARALADGGEPRPIIIKATRAASYDRQAPDAYATSGFVKEWAASSYLRRRSAAQPFAPALLAHDLDRGVLVIEDLGGSLPTLVARLLDGTAREAEQALTAYAEALAALHRATVGCRAGHAAVLREGFPQSAIPPPAQRWRDDVAQSLRDLPGGGPPPDELETVAERLRQPGAWQVLVHGDPCPDNVLLAADGRAILIDFEFARPGHALLDAAYWRMGFPTCWCAGTVPSECMDRVDRAYRAALGDAVPEAAEDDAFRRERAIADCAWLLGNLAWLGAGALAEDGRWGRATNRSRILTYAERAARSMEEADVLPSLRAWAERLRVELHASWPGSEPLPAFPAFTRLEGGR